MSVPPYEGPRGEGDVKTGVPNVGSHALDSLAEVNKAYARVAEGKVRFRAGIVNGDR